MHECINPTYAYLTGRLTKNGKPAYFIDTHHITLDNRLEIKHWMEKYVDIDYTRKDLFYHDDFSHKDYLTSYVKLPCGHCPVCQVSKASEWATRLYLEARDHDNYYFVTLTYRPEDYSPDRDFKRDLQLFLKRFRKNSGCHFRYFASFEYGERFGRGHFHLIMYFDEKINDNLTFLKANANNCYYTSALVQRCWDYGFDVTVPSDEPGAALAYVSRYCCKKAGDDKGFTTASRRPGIAAQWVDKVTDSVVLIHSDHHTSVKKLPLYLYQKLEKSNPELYEEIKAVKRKFVLHQYNAPRSKYDDFVVDSVRQSEMLKSFFADTANKFDRRL